MTTISPAAPTPASASHNTGTVPPWLGDSPPAPPHPPQEAPPGNPVVIPDHGAGVIWDEVERLLAALQLATMQ